MKKVFFCLAAVMTAAAAGYLFLPRPDLLHNFTFSSAIYDRNGKLLRLTTSRDQKYRLLTPLSEIPGDMQKALLLYEDRNFYRHPGVDPTAIARAMANMIGGSRKQGASTITMQLARLVFNIDSSTVGGKLEQMARAVQIERHYAKKEILEAYFNLAPYGENIEGAGAASLIYFGVAPKKLSLPEMLSLIVIPQNPVRRNPNKYPDHLTAARNVLANVWRKTYPGDIKNADLELPVRAMTRREIPFFAPHFTSAVLKRGGGRIQTTLELNLQRAVEARLANYLTRQASRGIQNAAVLVVDAEKMETLAYVGSADFWNEGISGQVDGVTAARSPGSAMKPFIYELALEQGLIHPLSLLKDVPRSYAFYNPENFDQKYRGAVSATAALVSSLNIPAVDLLQQLKPQSFYDLLQASGVKNLKPEPHYGLALALGGYELNLADMAAMYAMLYNKGVFREVQKVSGQTDAGQRLLTPEGCFLVMNMMAQNPPADNNAKYPVYWKTGTSYSFKDAWSVGIAGKYVIGVWIGNFDGTPNHAFVGRKAAAPLFFEIVRLLERQDEFGKYRLSQAGLNVRHVEVCRDTGDIANDLCPAKVPSWFIPGVSPIKLSNVHRQIPIDVKTGLRACRHMPPGTKLALYEFWPSDVLKAFERSGVSKKSPPPFTEECGKDLQIRGRAPMISYPVAGIVHVVRSHQLSEEKMVLKASADADVQQVYWFMDDALLGSAEPDGVLEIAPKIGNHVLKAVDDQGRTSSRSVTVVMAD